ncbi:type IV secretory system conjugative DNA transfer family protein [Helicobacter pylori]|nr:type IV secretory system conjugative DNA transfer family protein [Helicobacter pylori]
MDSHGKAVWAEMKDIIKYEYRIFNIFKGMLDPIIRNEANKWAKANDKEFASIKSVYSRFMQVFTSYQVKSATDSMSFEYEDLRKDNITLYIKIAQTDIDTLAPLIRILLESIAKNLLLKESKKFEERVYLFLDEFVRFGKLPFLLEMPALSRSYGVVLIFITQSNALIEKYYGREDARIVNSTVAYKVIFKMDDLEYAKQVSEEIGKMTRKTRSHSTEKGQLIMGGTSSISKEAWDLLSAQDIMNIDKDEVIILVSGHKAKPLKLKANYYFKNKELLSRINWEVKPNEEVFDALKKVV